MDPLEIVFIQLDATFSHLAEHRFGDQDEQIFYIDVGWIPISDDRQLNEGEVLLVLGAELDEFRRLAGTAMAGEEHFGTRALRQRLGDHFTSRELRIAGVAGFDKKTVEFVRAKGFRIQNLFEVVECRHRALGSSFVLDSGGLFAERRLLTGSWG